MELFQQVITNSDDIYVYFEIIRQINPASILDFGMMLKQIGAVSRQAMHCEIPKNAKLDGVDFSPEIILPIYHVIYDEIYGMDLLPDRQYDLAVMLGWTGRLDTSVLEHIRQHASVVLVDEEQHETAAYFADRCLYQTLQSDSKIYRLVYCKGV